jgi:hypothetical protein
MSDTDKLIAVRNQLREAFYELIEGVDENGNSQYGLGYLAAISDVSAWVARALKEQLIPEGET